MKKINEISLYKKAQYTLMAILFILFIFNIKNKQMELAVINSILANSCCESIRILKLENKIDELEKRD